MTTVNLHTHTVRCKHAKGYPIDYAKAAAERGIRVLGMTDHIGQAVFRRLIR